MLGVESLRSLLEEPLKFDELPLEPEKFFALLVREQFAELPMPSQPGGCDVHLLLIRGERLIGFNRRDRGNCALPDRFGLHPLFGREVQAAHDLGSHRLMEHSGSMRLRIFGGSDHGRRDGERRRLFRRRSQNGWQ